MKAISSRTASPSVSGDFPLSIWPAGISRCPTPKKPFGLAFNGEIYNFKELRAELEQHGHQFRTKSDTEVIIHGYKEWGTEVLNRLNGMFGLAIWDARKERLIVARDAMGIKLIYYRIDNGRLTFGSEIRPILAADGCKPDVDPVALNLFLRFRYTPSPLTIFKGIRKLAPGTMLIAENGECREERWYNYTPEPFASPRSEDRGNGRITRSVSRCCKTAPAQRCAGWDPSQRRARFRFASGPHE